MEHVNSLTRIIGEQTDSETHARTARGPNHLYTPFTYHTRIPRKIVPYQVPLTFDNSIGAALSENSHP